MQNFGLIKITLGLVLCAGLSMHSIAQDEPENLGKLVNSEYAELRPVISGDGKSLYFVVEGNPENTNYLTDNRAQDAWYSALDITGGWTKAERLPGVINSKTDNAIFWSSPDGDEILIRGAYEDGVYMGRGFSLCQKTLTGWSKPKRLKINGYQTMSQDLYDGATLSSDKKTLILYMSENKNSLLNDLYVSTIGENDEWSTPIKIEDSLSLEDYDEVTPFIAYDDLTLYFASNRPGGFGGYDIYKTTRLDDTWSRWSKPVNLGKPVNSTKSEAYFSVDISGDYGYMALMTSNNKTDLMRIKLNEQQKPKKSKVGSSALATKDVDINLDTSSMQVLKALDIPSEVRDQVLDLDRRRKAGGIEGEKAEDEFKLITSNPAEFFRLRRQDAIDKSQGISAEESGIDKITKNYDDLIQKLENLDSIDIQLLSNTNFSFKESADNSEKFQQVKEKDKSLQEGSDQDLTSNINWLGAQAPGGTTNHTYQWSQVGTLVTLRISLMYDVPGNQCTAAIIELPADCPVPFEPKGFKGNGSVLYFGNGFFMESSTAEPVVGNSFSNVLRKNSSGTGYEIYIKGASPVNPSVCYTTIQYYTY